ncbi:TadE/TadG family type IV pilus assembly protein [Sphingomonas sp. VNH70]|uniref:TadE/TadG family type IV pilus assembly protein n=1 Tax=Sphingomonas silueang TaxID=3156617 RepID=UPI0032B5B25F
MIAPLRALRRDRRGLALLEFALGLPIVLPIGLYAVELGNFSLRQMQLSQAALTLADNASRVGADTNMATQQLREVDINEIVQGLRLQTADLDLTTNGRVTISSLEVRDGEQWIHWQRCVGLKRGAGYDSSFGREGDGGRTGTAFRGMGRSGAPVMAPPAAAVIFVEINYDYQPLVASFFLGDRKLQQVGSFIVRDNRELDAGITNPQPAASERMTCDRYTA